MASVSERPPHRAASRRALLITLTELSDIAAAANAGVSNSPTNG